MLDEKVWLNWNSGGKKHALISHIMSQNNLQYHKHIQILLLFYHLPVFYTYFVENNNFVKKFFNVNSSWLSSYIYIKIYLSIYIFIKRQNLFKI